MTSVTKGNSKEFIIWCENNHVKAFLGLSLKIRIRKVASLPTSWVESPLLNPGANVRFRQSRNASRDSARKGEGLAMSLEGLSQYKPNAKIGRQMRHAAIPPAAFEKRVTLRRRQ